jgi:hypothetical protein
MTHLKLGLCCVLLVCFSCRTTTKPFPTSGREHPFYKTVKKVNTDEKSNGVTTPSVQPEFVEAKEVKTRTVSAKMGSTTISLALESTPEVPLTAIKYLEKHLKVVPVNIKARPDLEPFLSSRSKLMHGQPEVRLPQMMDPNGGWHFIAWPDGWDLVRPSVIRLRPDYIQMSPFKENDDDIGSSTAALIGSWTGVRGVLQSQGPGAAAQALGFVQVTINGITVNVDASGAFFIPGSFNRVEQLTVRYDGRISPVSGMSVGPRISVMNDFHNPRSENVDIASGVTSEGILNVGTIILRSLDADLFEIGTGILRDFHQLTRQFPPSPDGFRIKRWEGVASGTPYAYHDYVVIARNFQTDRPDRFSRQNTLLHEFGHTLRHAADGDVGHWGWDNFRWAYARNHNGTEVFNEHYAFNEGWANYWECTNSSFSFTCASELAGLPGPDFLDWNELRIGARLFDLANAPGVGHTAMFNILVNNPGTIHTLWEFEQKYCEAFPNNTFCRGGRPTRVKAACPPGYTDDGATCRLDNIRAKESYGRGVGTLPIGCGDAESQAGLCYERCRDGFDGVGPVCWRRCPPGMHDDGAFCRRDVQLVGANNSRCPWYDICGLTLEPGCSTCPTGFQNDGCICRIDAWIFAKESYARGVGALPTACGPGRVYDAGLCYDLCRPGFTGVGPVCWGRCPEGWDDHGGTCYRPPSILVKY